MNEFVISNVRLIMPESIIENSYIVVKDSKITEVNKGAPPKGIKNIDGENNYLSAGFVDMHIHGGGGFDVMDADENGYQAMAEAHNRHGTTSFVPTTASDSTENILKAISAYKKAKKQNLGINLLGLHLEGPYFSPVQAGAMLSRVLRSPDYKEYSEIMKFGGKDIIRWSLAPEIAGTDKFVEYMKNFDLTLSIGHSNADYDCVKNYFSRGLSLITHLYSAMSTVTRVNGFRFAGVLESAFLIDDMDVEIIADGCHLPSSLLQFVCKFKDKRRIALITDAMRASGQNVKISYIGEKNPENEVIIEDGVAKLKDRSAFAGSIATTDRLLKTMLSNTNVSLTEAVRMLTVNPLRMLKLNIKKGIILPQYDADLVMFDDKINVINVWVEGNLVFKA